MANDLFDTIVDSVAKASKLSKKVTQRMINHLVYNRAALLDLRNNLEAINNRLNICKICQYYTLDNACVICTDTSRDKQIICVVASALDAYNIEKNQQYHGLYHILDGEINLNKNVTPNDIGIEKLHNRLTSSTEVILALNATFEGELTANYIFQTLKKLNINITRIAKGIPVGGSLDYMDQSTLNNAFKNRKKYEA